MNTAQLIAALLVAAGVVLSISGVGSVFGVPMIIVGIAVLILDGAFEGAVNLGLLATGKHRVQTPDSGDTSGPLYQGVERETLQPNSYTYYDFQVPQLESGDAVLDLDIHTFSDETVNVIFTTQDERRQFEGKADIKILDKFTEYNVDDSTISGLLSSGNWSVILDNTGGIRDVDGSQPIDVEMKYEIRR